MFCQKNFPHQDSDLDIETSQDGIWRHSIDLFGILLKLALKNVETNFGKYCKTLHTLLHRIVFEKSNLIVILMVFG